MFGVLVPCGLGEGTDFFSARPRALARLGVVHSKASHVHPGFCRH